MSARRLLPVALLATLVVGAAFAGCKDKESLVIVTLTGAADPTLVTATISVGPHAETFALSSGISAQGVTFGVYVPSSIKGKQSITVVASPAQAGNCNGQTGTGEVNITSVGEPYGPIAIALSPSTTACPGTGGTTGTGGSHATGGSGTAGTSGAAGSSGAAGTTGTGGTNPTGGHAGGTGLGGVGGHAGGAATGGMGGRAGAPGTGGTAGAGAMGGSSGPPKGISACFEYDHSTNGTCTSSCVDGTSIYGAAFSPKNSGLAVTSGTDGRTKVWTVVNGAMTAEGHVLSGGGDGLVSFSPDGTLLAIGLDAGVQIVSTSNWTVVRTLTVANMVYGVSFTPDGTQIVTLTTDNSSTPPASHLYVHAVTSVTPSQTVALTDGWAMGVSPATVGGALPIAVTTETGSVLLFNLTAAGLSSPTTVPVTSNQTTVETAGFSPGGTLLAAGGNDGYLRFWSIPLTGSAQTTTIGVYGATNAASSTVDAVAFSPDGAEIAVGGGGVGSVTTYATAARARVGADQYTSSHADVTVLGYSPDGRWIIGGEYSCGCVFLCKH